MKTGTIPFSFRTRAPPPERTAPSVQGSHKPLRLPPSLLYSFFDLIKQYHVAHFLAISQFTKFKAVISSISPKSLPVPLPTPPDSARRPLVHHRLPTYIYPVTPVFRRSSPRGCVSAAQTAFSSAVLHKPVAKSFICPKRAGLFCGFCQLQSRGISNIFILLINIFPAAPFSPPGPAAHCCKGGPLCLPHPLHVPTSFLLWPTSSAPGP